MRRFIAIIVLSLPAGGAAVGQDANPPRSLDAAQKRIAELERVNRLLESRVKLLTEQVESLRESNEALAAALQRHAAGANETDNARPADSPKSAAPPAPKQPAAPAEPDKNKDEDKDKHVAKRLREHSSALSILRDLPFAARPRPGGRWDDDDFKRAGDWLARQKNPFEAALTVKSVRIAALREDEQRHLETKETHKAVFEFEVREWDYFGLTLREEVTGVTLLGGQDLVGGAERITKGARLRVSGTINTIRLRSNVANGSIKELTIELEKPMVHSNFLRAWMEKH